MICPKCGFEQPENAECMRCGVIISRYKGPVLGAAPVPPAVVPPVPSTFSASPAPVRPMGVEAARTMYAELGTAGTGEGTIYAGTVYAGPAPGVPAPTFGMTESAAKGSFEVGKVLGEAFSIYFRNFVPFLLLSIVALSPMLLSMVMLITGAAAKMGPGMAISLLVLIVFGALFGIQLATASITYGVFQQMRGRDVSIPDCLGRGLSSLPSVLGLIIIQTLGLSRNNCLIWQVCECRIEGWTSARCRRSTRLWHPC
jgi:hypothetical protein